MILYHASTVYHTLCCIVHKQSAHKEQKAILFLVEYMLPKAELLVFVENLKEVGWFQEIKIVPEKSFLLQRGIELSEDSTEEEIKFVIKNICTVVEKWYKLGLKNFDEYYVAADNWSIGIYLLVHRIPYNYFEDACGIMGDRERFLRIIKNLNEPNYIISNYLQGVGRSEIVKHIYCSTDFQTVPFTDKRVVDFTVFNCVKKMTDEDVNKLLNFYGIQSYPLKECMRNVLFLSQRLPTLTIQKIEVQERMTVLLIDYFCSQSNIIIKPHPKDVWIDYKRLIPDCYVVDRNAPSELLPFMLMNSFDLCITPNSTSVHGLSYIANTVMSFGNDYEIHYENIHIYYLVMKVLVSALSISNITTDSVTQGYLTYFAKNNANEEMDMDNSIQIQSESTELSGNTSCEWIIQSDYHTNNSYNKNGNYIFLNEESNNSFLLTNSNEYSKYVILEFEVINIIDEQIERQGTIWIYQEQEGGYNRLSDIKGSYELPNTKAVLYYQTKECNELRIAKGKIRALEYAMKQSKEDAINHEKGIDE